MDLPAKAKTSLVAANKLAENELTCQPDAIYKACCYWKLTLLLAFASLGSHQTTSSDVSIVRRSLMLLPLCAQPLLSTSEANVLSS